MRYAVIDIAGDMLVEATRVLCDAGLRISASLRSDEMAGDSVRIVFEDEFEAILPEQCGRPGWHLVRPQMVMQAYGGQRLTRVEKFEVLGRLVFAPNGTARVDAPPASPDTTEQRAAAARASAILGAIADRAGAHHG